MHSSVKDWIWCDNDEDESHIHRWCSQSLLQSTIQLALVVAVFLFFFWIFSFSQVLTCSWHCEQRLSSFLSNKEPVIDRLRVQVPRAPCSSFRVLASGSAHVLREAILVRFKYVVLGQYSGPLLVEGAEVSFCEDHSPFFVVSHCCISGTIISNSILYLHFTHMGESAALKVKSSTTLMLFGRNVLMNRTCLGTVYERSRFVSLGM